MNKSKRNLLILCLIVGTVIAIAFLRKPKPPEPTKIDSGQLILMGTFARIQIYCKSPKEGHKALNEALQTLKHADKLFSTYRTDSELALINREASKHPLKISPETFFVLKKAIEYSKLTNGAFDITVTPLIKLWKSSARKGIMPTKEQLLKARQLVGYTNIILSKPDMTVKFKTKNLKLNVDAIAKGYSVDLAMQAIRKCRVDSALIDIGGEIACFGREWIVGIQNPFDTNSLKVSPLITIKLTDKCVATSGNYRRYVTIDGKKFSHIINPATGEPAEKIPSVTIIAGKTIDADALATAVSVIGVKKGLKLIESIPNTEALLITGTERHYQVHISSGFSKYEIKG